MGKQASEFRLDTLGAVEEFQKGLPLFRGDGKITPVGENVLGLKASTFENEFCHGDAGKVGARSDQTFLAVGSAEIDTPSPVSFGAGVRRWH
jgi:hypothetical protein